MGQDGRETGTPCQLASRVPLLAPANDLWHAQQVKGPQDVAAQLQRSLDAVDGLPEGDIESIAVLIRAGEWQVALETLCTQVFEYDLTLPADLRAELTRLGEELDVPAAYLLGDPWAPPPGSVGESGPT